LLTKKKDKLPKNKSESIVVGEDTSTYLQ
ncbi:hypothetical protein CP8484711_1352B, partial [Chlamydia psittaci 84-8471/1]